MQRAYDPVLLSELRKHTWNFSIRRANLPADATAPVFGKTKYFPLPGDYLFLAPEETTFSDPSRRDFNLETLNNSLCIVSNLDAPLPIRYVSSNITESLFDPLFAEGLSAALAVACCEEITNSGSKIQTASAIYKEQMQLAKRRNAFENAPVKSPTCSWIYVRG